MAKVYTKPQPVTSQRRPSFEEEKSVQYEPLPIKAVVNFMQTKIFFKTGEMYHPDSVVKIHKKILKDAGL